MATGRPPLPTRNKIMRGNPGKRKLNRREPKVRAQVPVKPAQLHGFEAETWVDVCSILNDMGILSSTDKYAIGAYVKTIVEMHEAEKSLEKYGRYWEAEVGCVANPAIRILADADRRMRMWSTEFGMTPAARSRIVMPKGDADEKNADPAEQYFGKAA